MINDQKDSMSSDPTPYDKINDLCLNFLKDITDLGESDLDKLIYLNLSLAFLIESTLQSVDEWRIFAKSIRLIDRDKKFTAFAKQYLEMGLNKQ